MNFVKSFVIALAERPPETFNNPDARAGPRAWRNDICQSVKLSCMVLLQYAVVGFALNGTTAHCRSHVALEAFSVVPQILGSLLIQRIGRVRLQE